MNYFLRGTTFILQNVKIYSYSKTYLNSLYRVVIFFNFIIKSDTSDVWLCHVFRQICPNPYRQKLFEVYIVGFGPVFQQTRAPIYSVLHYVDHLKKQMSTSTLARAAAINKSPQIKDGISPLSYLLRKLKLDLKMSYDRWVVITPNQPFFSHKFKKKKFERFIFTLWAALCRGFVWPHRRFPLPSLIIFSSLSDGFLWP